MRSTATADAPDDGGIIRRLDRIIELLSPAMKVGVGGVLTNLGGAISGTGSITTGFTAMYTPRPQPNEYVESIRAARAAHAKALKALNELERWAEGLDDL